MLAELATEVKPLAINLDVHVSKLEPELEFFDDLLVFDHNVIITNAHAHLR